MDGRQEQFEIKPSDLTNKVKTICCEKNSKKTVYDSDDSPSSVISGASDRARKPVRSKRHTLISDKLRDSRDRAVHRRKAPKVNIRQDSPMPSPDKVVIAEQRRFHTGPEEKSTRICRLGSQFSTTRVQVSNVQSSYPADQHIERVHTIGYDQRRGRATGQGQQLTRA